MQEFGNTCKLKEKLQGDASSTLFPHYVPNNIKYRKTIRDTTSTSVFGLQESKLVTSE